MASPSRLAHYVLRTNQLTKMVTWYCILLDARINFRNDVICFITYDDEHHRVAFVATETYAEKPSWVQVGFYHAAFAFDTLSDLLKNYRRLKALDVLPYRCVNHGPTVSLYYRDPDRNDVEMQVDAFPNAEAASAFMRSEHFARNPIGLPIDPEDFISKLEAGIPESNLLRRADL
ncbi:VOC family protein [Paraburkholderia sp. LEh10]|uniref:VOC family protein n=1 Tax=Paraburkholderia sp. LEh10 TaxID=2821353 RepID=UPI001AE868D3|nr:VOC family protein [Paraburkholderia sp. LEh10]MBP0590462.1 VOC family protein [Paraburkholderia sp. LEh10]